MVWPKRNKIKGLVILQGINKRCEHERSHHNDSDHDETRPSRKPSFSRCPKSYGQSDTKSNLCEWWDSISDIEPTSHPIPHTRFDWFRSKCSWGESCDRPCYDPCRKSGFEHLSHETYLASSNVSIDIECRPAARTRTIYPIHISDKWPEIDLGHFITLAKAVVYVKNKPKSPVDFCNF